MINYKSIGRRIAFYRKRAEMTQCQLSEQLGISESYVSQIECGATHPSLTRLSQIADILGVDIAVLISDKVSVSDISVNAEIFQIIKDWPAEQVSFLADLLICADTKMKKLNG